MKPATLAAIAFTAFPHRTILIRTIRDKLGGWHIANLNYHLTKNWILYAEVQTRSQKLTDDFFYHELKGGVSYAFPFSADHADSKREHHPSAID